MNRLDAELAAIDDAIAAVEFLGYTPRHDTWSGHCAALGRELSRTMQKRLGR